MLMLKLTFSSSVTRGVGSIRGIVNNQADTYMIGADRNVLITIPAVTYRKDREKDIEKEKLTVLTCNLDTRQMHFWAFS